MSRQKVPGKAAREIRGRLKALVQQAGGSRAFAKAAGLNHRTVEDWFDGPPRLVDASILLRLGRRKRFAVMERPGVERKRNSAPGLGVNPAWLLFGDGPLYRGEETTARPGPRAHVPEPATTGLVPASVLLERALAARAGGQRARFLALAQQLGLHSDRAVVVQALHDRVRLMVAAERAARRIPAQREAVAALLAAMRAKRR